MSIVLKTLVTVPVVLLGSYFYVSALIEIGRRTKGKRPPAVTQIAATLVWCVYASFIVSPLFWLIFTEIEPVSDNDPVKKIEEIGPVLLSYLVMVSPGIVYIVKFRMSELRKYGYFVENHT